jgi:hypothetical protein
MPISPADLARLTAETPSFHIGARIPALCADGVVRQALITGPADTFFSIPASVKAHGRTVSGYVSRSSLEGFDTATPEDPAVTTFRAYTYRANFDAIPAGNFGRGPEA